MDKLDIEKIKKMTNFRIGLDNYESEEFNKMKKLKVLSFTVLAVCILAGGTFTVDAMTDNAISNAVKDVVNDVLKIKVNGEDYNSHCEKSTDGTIKCTVDKNVVGSEIEAEVSMEITQDLIDNGKEENFSVEFEYE